MLRMIIIDDEEQVIRGLKKFVDWNTMGIEIIETASNGREGLEKIRLLEPDIVLTDIRMPIADGLEVIRTINTEGLSAKVVVLSGYEEFEYAKESMKSGVLDYIVKPSLPDEIFKAMEKVVKICNEEKESIEQERQIREKLKQSIPILTEKLIEEVFDGNICIQEEIEEKANFLGFSFVDKNFQVITIQIDSYSDFIKKNSEEIRQLKKISILLKARQYFGVDKTYINFKEKNAYLLLVLDKKCEENQNLNIVENASMLIEEVLEMLSVSISIGVGELIEETTNIKNSFSQSKECLKYKMQFGNGKVIFYEDIIYTQLKIPVLQLYNKDMLVDGLKLRDKEMVLKCIDDMVNNLNRSKIIDIDCVKMALIEMVGIVSFTLYQMGEKEYDILREVSLWEAIEEKETINEIKVWVEEFFVKVFDGISNKVSQRITRILEQIDEYIKNNYDKDISINDLSKKIFLTPNYLSNIFSQNTGENFTKYLSRYRIERAKTLIRSGNYKLYEIGEMVGYKNSDYFRKVFKEYTGVSPSEY